MPHCCPQKQQCVFTVFSSACDAVPDQPPGGMYFSVGPNWRISSSMVAGGLGTSFLLCFQLRERKCYSFAAGTNLLPKVFTVAHRIIKTQLRQYIPQVIDLHAGGETFPTP